jgi:hypothetical protein
MDPMLRIHDVPDPGAHNPWRTETITPLQGLFALNSPFMQQQAAVLAKGAQNRDLGELYARVLQRAPSEKERQVAQNFLLGREADLTAWTHLAQALLASNEMLFVD